MAITTVTPRWVPIVKRLVRGKPKAFELGSRRLEDS